MNTLLRLLARHGPLGLRMRACYRIPGHLPLPKPPYPLYFAPGCALHEVKATDLIGRAIAFSGVYEAKLSQRLSKLAKMGGHLVDVGANIGYFTHIWMTGAPGNTVTALEASPRVFPLLEKNIKVHPWADRVCLIPKAASNQSGTVTFDTGPEDQLGWGGINLESNVSGGISIPAERLDLLIPNGQPIAFLKIDVEGADPLVLLGAEGLLRRRQVRAGCFEVNKQRMAMLNLSVDPALQLLENCGYQISVAHDDEIYFQLS